MVVNFIIPRTISRTAFQVSHETVGIQGSVRRHRIARSTPAPGFFPDDKSCLPQDPIEHFVRRWLGVINGLTMVPPCSDVKEERTSELAFESAENATCVVLKMGPPVHAGQDAVQRASVAALSSIVILYRVIDLSQSPAQGHSQMKAEPKSRVLVLYVAREVSM